MFRFDHPRSSHPRPRAGEPAPSAAGPTPDQATVNPASAESLSPYSLPEGAWTAGTLRVEVTGGIEITFNLPFVSGETAAGRTTIVCGNDEDDNEYSKGLVRISVSPDADSVVSRQATSRSPGRARSPSTRWPPAA